MPDTAAGLSVDEMIARNHATGDYRRCPGNGRHWFAYRGWGRPVTDSTPATAAQPLRYCCRHCRHRPRPDRQPHHTVECAKCRCGDE